MDLFGRGWHRDVDIWRIRGELNRIGDILSGRKKPYSPQIALIVHEDRFLCGGMDRKRVGFSSRKGFAACGADYGQYFPEDVLDNPPQSVKLFPNGAGNNHDVV